MSTDKEGKAMFEVHRLHCDNPISTTVERAYYTMEEAIAHAKRINGIVFLVAYTNHGVKTSLVNWVPSLA